MGAAGIFLCDILIDNSLCVKELQTFIPLNILNKNADSAFLFSDGGGLLFQGLEDFLGVAQEEDPGVEGLHGEGDLGGVLGEDFSGVGIHHIGSLGEADGLFALVVGVDGDGVPAGVGS